jgi:hypothetical protein
MKKIASIFLFMVLSISLFGQTKTGTLKLFSELTGISVYIDESQQVPDTKSFVLPIGTHYLKVLLDKATVYGELVEIKENSVTTVLIKNTGQVQEKVMESKTPERQEYQNSKIDIILSSNSISETTGKSNFYPGFYGYYGYNKSNTVTTQVSDFKIIQGGVKEIGDIGLATLAGNKDILARNAADNTRQYRQASTGGAIFLGSFIVTGTLMADMLVKKPFLHKQGTTASDGEVAVAAVGITACTISYVIIMGSDKHKPAHYYTPDIASQDAQKVNNALKTKLGLPESYGVN